MSRCTDCSARPNKPRMTPGHPHHAWIAVRSRSAARSRRGVLLLVVLSMLALFLMLGAAYLLAASRARDAAKAYARLTFGSDEARIPAPALLDSVLLRVVRGPIVIGSGTFESLLADKYGGPTTSGTPTLSGSFSNIVRTGPVLTGSLTTATGVHPTDLAGRVLTLSHPGRPVTSHRIVQAVNSGSTNATGTSFSLALDMPFTGRPFTLPTGTVPVIVNGREFSGVPSTSGTSSPSNENWDGFDEHNQFLAQLRSSTTSISQADVIRGSFMHRSNIPTFAVSGTSYTLTKSATSANVLLVTGTTDFPETDFPNGDLIMDAADNDGDGVIDGIFQDFGLPDVTDAAGNAVKLRASVLVVDLDGRFNVNAHHGMSSLVYGGTTHWPNTAVLATGSVPLGSGYGASEVDGSKLFVNAPQNAPLVSQGGFANTENPTLLTMTGASPSEFFGTRSGTSGSRYSNAELTPRLSYPEGRYGEQAANGWSFIERQLISNGAPSQFARPGFPGTDDDASRISDRRAPPSVEASVSYGIPSVWWTGTSAFNWGVGGNDFPLPRGVFNSPPDLHGRMKTLTLSATGSGIAPRVAFAQPEWSSGTASGSRNESRDDPYELFVDTRQGRGGVLFDPSTSGTTASPSSLSRDNPFTPAELEAVLRPYDGDTNKCPPRLAAMLGSAAEESRLKVTTDSWDTTAITGSAAIQIFGSGTLPGWLQQRLSGSALLAAGTNPVGGVLNGEIARGERFDLNRALVAKSATSAGYNAAAPYWQQRQAYFKDFYTLLVMLSSTGAGPQVSIGGQLLTGTQATTALAQLAANVVDFRDADSTLSTFEYDTDLTDGWSPDGNLATTGDDDRAEVVGAERPELVIAETFAWENDSTGELFVVLHRPWNASAYGSGSSSIAGEPCDPQLDTGAGQVANALDLGRKAANKLFTSGTTYPIWRLRVTSTTGGSDVFARFDSGTAAGGGTTSVSGSVTSAAATPKMLPDSWLCVRGANTIPITISGELQQVTLDQGGVFRVPGSQGNATTTATRPAVVYLERLTDPLDDPTDTTWTNNPATGVPRYQVVDSGTINVIYSGNGPGNPNRQVGNQGNDKPVGNAGGNSTPPPRSWRRVVSGTSSFWKPAFIEHPLGNSLTLAPFQPDAVPNHPRWFPWTNRPFVSSAELMLVPRFGPEQLLTAYDGPVTALSGSCGLAAVQGLPQLLFDAVHVPTRFAGIHTTTTSTAALEAAGISALTTPANQFSTFREPGRVNLNTVSAEDVWNAVVAGRLTTSATSAAGAGFGMTVSGTQPARPARSMHQLLTLSGTGTTIWADAQTPSSLEVDLNPLHGIYTATRLANTTTPRSNVFGVWITLRQSIPNDPDSVRYHRAFYIVDRSIPVGFEEGKDHNVWDCVRVRRIIE